MINTRYLFVPKNPMIHHCSESFYKAITSSNDGSSTDSCVYLVDYLTLNKSLSLMQNLISINSKDTISIFFFLIQSDYFFLGLILKMVAKILSKNLIIYYLMHEPKFEKGRINPLKAFFVYFHNLLFGYLGDKILVPSDEALIKAKTFIASQKLYKVNLSFISPQESSLQKNLLQLKCSWENTKTFSLLGRADVDKNPQGFLSLAKIADKYYPEKARFIRGGADRNINVSYDEKLIVRFPNFLSSNTKKFLYDLTHFVVIPYSFSTQSGVVAEALSYGKLLIVNDIPAFSYLKEQTFAFVIDFNDENAIFNCVNELFSMDVNNYERCYWEAVKYFQKYHSEMYLSKTLSNIL